MWSVLFDLRPGDGWPLVILLGHSFLKGAVRVHGGDKFIASLGPGEVFGELAALDPEPRMGHAELGELMTEHSEVGNGIIHVLCRRLWKQ